MEKIKMSTNLWYVRFYMRIYGKDEHTLPEYTCDLRRSLILPILFFPLYFPAYYVVSLIEKIWKDFQGDIRLMLLLTSLSFSLFIVLEKSVSFPVNICLTWLFGSLFATICLAIFFLIIFIILYSNTIFQNNMEDKKILRKRYTDNNEKTPNKIYQLYNFLKEKFCSKIEWIN